MSAIGTIDGMNSIDVFYSPRLVAHKNASFSPSAHKPAAVVASWKSLPVSLTWRTPTPATIAELGLTHDAHYVDDVLACRINNGFDNRLPEVAASLPWTSGAMLSAARHVLSTS